ncbi:MAG: acyl-CoA dehydrogenase family protein [Candidatus Nanopelagicales bacterium]|nr:acyl-CoA dehydrogenase family protein [Candidatus Nanopelagicales bacterium]
MTSAPEYVRSPWHGHANEEELAQWSAVAEEVGVAIAKDALERDKDSIRPFAALQLVRESGLANLLVPTAFGGHGGHWATAFLMTRIIARYDASVAQLLGYHYVNQACVVFYGPDEAQQAQWLARSAEKNLLWSDSFNPVSPDLKIVADGDNYLMSGLKRFATGASVTDVVIGGGVAEGGAYDGQVIVFAVDTNRAGVEHLDDWDHLGQRSSASGSVRYTNVVITPEDIFGIDVGEPFSSVVTPGVQLLFGNIYLGIAEGALAQAKELTLARSNAWFLSGVDRYSEDPITHRVFGELVARTVAVEALADRVNRQYESAIAIGGATTEEDRARIEIAVAQLKVISTEVGLEVSSRVFEVTGASATKMSYGLDIFWRNIRTHSLHDPVDYKKIEVGANFLTGAVQPISLYT